MKAMPGCDRNLIEALADRLELDLTTLQTCWSEIPDDERAAVIGRIGANAPGIARLLCPQFHRFGASHELRVGKIG